MDIQVTVESIVGEEAILKTEDGRFVRCSRSLAGDALQPGQKLWLSLGENKPSAATPADILNEILTPHESDMEKAA